MASIRWLFEKHMKDVPVPLVPTTVCERKEQRPSAIITVDIAVDAVKLAAKGWMIKDIAAKYATSPTTISNIVHKKKAYKTMPSTEKEIRIWFGQKHTKYEPTAQHRR